MIFTFFSNICVYVCVYLYTYICFKKKPLFPQITKLLMNDHCHSGQTKAFFP